MQLLVFWTLSIVQSLFKKQRFGDWILSPSSGKSLLSLAQSTELVSISGPDNNCNNDDDGDNNGHIDSTSSRHYK
jgi:hypothetical protein